MGYQPSKFQCSRMSGSNFMEGVEPQCYNEIKRHSAYRISPIHAGVVGEVNLLPLRFFLHNSKTPEDIKKKLSDFNFTPLTVILGILSITIVVRLCHSNLLFPVCHISFLVEKTKKLELFSRFYLIKPKFGIGAIFRP